MSQKVQDEPSDVVGKGGEVMVDGPDGVVVSLTPAAARETGTRLRHGADDAEHDLIDEPNSTGGQD